LGIVFCVYGNLGFDTDFITELSTIKELTNMNKLTRRILVVLLVAAMFVYAVVKHETVIAIVMGVLLLLNGFLLVLVIKDQNKVQ
jgi:uncharacterized membrane protein YjjP (DUF1212 family)